MLAPLYGTVSILASLDPPVHDLDHLFSKGEKVIIKNSDLGIDGPEPWIRILDDL